MRYIVLLISIMLFCACSSRTGISETGVIKIYNLTYQGVPSATAFQIKQWLDNVKINDSAENLWVMLGYEIPEPCRLKDKFMRRDQAGWVEISGGRVVLKGGGHNGVCFGERQ